MVRQTAPMASKKKPKKPAVRGFRCPKCQQPNAVNYGRHRPDGSYRRRRICPCGFKFQTVETVLGKNNSPDGLSRYIDGPAFIKVIPITPSPNPANVPSTIERN